MPLISKNCQDNDWMSTSERLGAVLDTNIRGWHLRAVLDTNIKFYKYYWSTSENGTQLKVLEAQKAFHSRFF